MNNRSREEIERQFRPNDTPKRTSTTVEGSRTVKVIGGEIQGLGANQNYKISYKVWAVIGFIFLTTLGLFVFFGERDSQNTPNKLTNIEENSINENDTLSLNYTRSNDLDRAKEYRRIEIQDKKIKQLLTNGLTAFKNGSYSEPQGTSAVDYFRQILEIDPNYYRAKDGIEAINNRFLEIGETHLENGDIKSAEIALKNLRNIQPDSYHALGLEEKITTFREEKPLNDALKNAELAISLGAWISPNKQNALYFYRQALNIDNANEKALEGVNQVLINSILLANAAITEDDIDNANSYVSAIQSIKPDHQSIALLRGRIADKATGTIEQQLNSFPITSSQPLIDNNQGNRSNIVFDQKTPVEELDESNLRLGLAAYNNSNYLKSVDLLTPLADKGITRARARLSLIYHLGKNVTPNRGLAEQYAQQAISSLRQFANEGRAWAQADLGSMYANGLAVNKNLNAALLWRERAANQQYAEAQRDIADMYYFGNGVTQNQDTAIFYYQDAARNGDIKSRQALAKLGAPESQR